MNPRAIMPCLLTLVLAACGSGGSGDGEGDRRGEPYRDFPRMAAGTHLSIQRNFFILSDEMEAETSKRLAEAEAAGVRSGRIMLDWPELEPAPGSYDLGDLEEAIDDATAAGHQLLVTIPIVDTTGYGLPADLAAGPEAGPRDGRPLDHPEIRARLRALLDAMAPLLASDAVFALALANEPEAHLETAELTALAKLIGAGRRHLRGLHPDLAVGATLTATGLIAEEPGVLAILAQCDGALANYYRPTVDGLIAPLAMVDADLDALLAITAPRALYLQELGCTAGLATDSPSGASADGQADFFSLVLARLGREERLRGASIFILFDLAEPHWALWEDLFRAEFEADLGDDPLVDELIRQLEDYWVPVGLGTRDGTMRPAWDVVLDAIATEAAL